jgi:hypothetical protein
MLTESNNVFSGDQLCDFEAEVQCFGDILYLPHQGILFWQLTVMTMKTNVSLVLMPCNLANYFQPFMAF